MGRHLAVRVLVDTEEKRWSANQKGKDEVGADGSSTGAGRSLIRRMNFCCTATEGKEAREGGRSWEVCKCSWRSLRKVPSSIVHFLSKLSALTEE